jgi:hypothetical protein
LKDDVEKARMLRLMREILAEQFGLKFIGSRPRLKPNRSLQLIWNRDVIDGEDADK